MAKAGGSLTVTAQVAGLKQLTAALKELDKKVQKKVVRKAVREGAKVIQQAAKEEVPVDTGLTKKAIKVRAAKAKKRGDVSVQVRVGEGDYKGDQFYAAFVEYGHFVGSRELGNKRSFVEPNPFMRRAFDSTHAKAQTVIAEEIKKGIESQ